MKHLIRNLTATCAATAATGLVGQQALAQDVMPGGYWNNGWGYGHMMTGGLIMIVFWGGLIVLVALLVRWLAGEGMGSRTRGGGSNALDILKERFARGEIDEEEFHARRKTLEASDRK